MTRRPIVPLVPLCLALVAASAGAADVKHISRGGRVDIEDHLAADKYTLVDFYAKWCGGCRAVAPKIKRLARKHEDALAVRKVDVVNWNSAVAKQYRIESLPRLDLYAPDGERLASGSASRVLRKLEKALKSGRPKVADDPDSEPARAGVNPVDDPGDDGGDGNPLLLAATVAVGAVTTFAVSALGWHLWRRERPAGSIGRAALWYVERADGFDGPYTTAQLARLQREGRVGGDTPVCRKQDAERTTVADAVTIGT